jgi:hypothetical protein
MSESIGLRRRVGSSVVQESTPLLEETSFIEIGEEEALAAFAEAEAVGAGLDETGIGAPIGIAIGILAGLGYGGYEIYQKLKPHTDKSYHEVNKHIAKHFEQKNHLAAGIDSTETDIVNLEQQGQTTDIVPLEKQHRGLVPPPFKYLGPGNSLNQGTAYNQIDEDAQIHDTEYSVAKTEAEVQASDRKFISGAVDHIAEGLTGKGTIGDSLGGALGAVGIGGKHLLEKATGQLYPSFSGKQWHHLLIELSFYKKILVMKHI